MSSFPALRVRGPAADSRRNAGIRITKPTRRSLSRRTDGTEADASDELRDRLRAFDSDQPLIQTGVTEGQAIRVESELVQYGGVEVLDVEAVLDGAAAKLIGGAHGDAARETAAGQPEREAVGVVITTRALGVFRGGLTAEFSGPDDERVVEHAAPLQIR